MSDDYNILVNELQSVFKAANIQSMEAMMMGLYPGNDVNVLNEWQQGNAVPPIDYDYSQWQDSLGIFALPYGFNTFAMFQTGRADDYFLAISDYNCQLFDKYWRIDVQDIDYYWKNVAYAQASNILTGNTT